MKRVTKGLVVAVALALPGAAMALGILGTDHDFATKAGYMATQTPSGDGTTVSTGTNQVGLCSYCHTPHSAQSTLLLWNHKMSSAVFTWDDAQTTGGTGYATMNPTYKGPSVKCLSCHDGSVAIGDVSLYKEVKGPGAVFNTFNLSTQTIKKIGAGGAMAGNHPVGMPYPLGQASSTYNGQTTGARVPLTEFVSNPVAANGTNGTFIKLYKDNGSGSITVGTAAGATGIECTSCHDPHNKQVTNTHQTGTPTLLLRGAIDGSQASDGYICTQCHIK
jgi:hypothetical protein